MVYSPQAVSNESQAPPVAPTTARGTEKTNRLAPMQILLVEDEIVLARNVQRALESEGHTVEWLESGEAALGWLRNARPDLVLLDNRLPGMSGLETLQQLRAIDPTIIVIMMTAFATLEDAVSAMRLGAADFVRKPVGLAELELAIERVIEKDRLQQELRFYRHQRGGRDARGVLGHSPAVQEVRRTIERLSTLPRSGAGGPTVLFTGETGTGKGLLARTLHAAGARSEGPFIDLNCTAIPESLLESELFGYEKGAFTDARTAKPGLVEAAEGGTLFLDEIGHVGGSVQAKLLKVIEEKTVRRLGSLRDRMADVWVVAATNRDLGEAVARGRVSRGSLSSPARRRDPGAAAARARRRRARAGGALSVRSCRPLRRSRADPRRGRPRGAARLSLAGQRSRAGQRHGARRAARRGRRARAEGPRVAAVAYSRRANSRSTSLPKASSGPTSRSRSSNRLSVSPAATRCGPPSCSACRAMPCAIGWRSTGWPREVAGPSTVKPAPSPVHALDPRRRAAVRGSPGRRRIDRARAGHRRRRGKRERRRGHARDPRQLLLRRRRTPRLSPRGRRPRRERPASSSFSMAV